jgi:hypothetical protein
MTDFVIHEKLLQPNALCNSGYAVNETLDQRSWQLLKSLQHKYCWLCNSVTTDLCVRIDTNLKSSSLNCHCQLWIVKSPSWLFYNMNYCVEIYIVDTVKCHSVGNRHYHWVLCLICVKQMRTLIILFAIVKRRMVLQHRGSSELLNWHRTFSSICLLTKSECHLLNWWIAAICLGICLRILASNRILATLHSDD